MGQQRNFNIPVRGAKGVGLLQVFALQHGHTEDPISVGHLVVEGWGAGGALGLGLLPLIRRGPGSVKKNSKVMSQVPDSGYLDLALLCFCVLLAGEAILPEYLVKYTQADFLLVWSK